MKILMTNHCPLEGSGSGTYVKNLALQMVKLGHEVCVILPENSTDFPQYDGIRMHPVFFTNPDKPEDTAPNALPFNFPLFTTHPTSTTTFGDYTDEEMQAYLDSFREAIIEEVNNFKPDIIHGQHIWAIPAQAAGLGVPMILTAHGTDLMGYDKWPEMRYFAEAAMEACEKVICISADNEELVRKTFPQYADKVVRKRNGYDPDTFYPKKANRTEVLARHGVDGEGKDLILFAGKMTNFKGIDVLMDAAVTYEPALPNAITVLAGDGQERPSLEAQVKRNNLQHVYFIGNVTQSELADLYRVADIDLVPSRREPFGLVAIEAMACGTPVVATNQGGLPDFVDSSVGALVEPENAEDLALGIIKTMDRAVCNPEWRTKIADYAVQNYSQAVIIAEIEELYRSVINEA